MEKDHEYTGNKHNGGWNRQGEMLPPTPDEELEVNDLPNMPNKEPECMPEMLLIGKMINEAIVDGDREWIEGAGFTYCVELCGWDVESMRDRALDAIRRQVRPFQNYVGTDLPLAVD